MQGATNPDRAGGLKYAMALGHPFLGEFEILLPSLALVPITFVDAYHPTSMAGDSAVGQQVRRISPNGVKVVVGHPSEDVNGLTVEKPPSEVCRIYRNRIGIKRCRFCGYTCHSPIFDQIVEGVKGGFHLDTRLRGNDGGRRGCDMVAYPAHSMCRSFWACARPFRFTKGAFGFSRGLLRGLRRLRCLGGRRVGWILRSG